MPNGPTDFDLTGPTEELFVETPGEFDQYIDFRTEPWRSKISDVKYAAKEIIEHDDDPEYVSVARKVLEAAKVKGAVILTGEEYQIFTHSMVPVFRMSEAVQEALGPSAEGMRLGVGKLFELFEEGEQRPEERVTRTVVPADPGPPRSKEDMIADYETKKRDDPSWQVPPHWRQWGWDDSWVA